MIITEGCTAIDIKALANGYTSDPDLIDMIDHPEEWEGITVEVEEDYSEDEYNAQNDTLQIVKIICGDKSFARFGYYKDGGHTVVDALDDSDTMEDWLNGWISNNGKTEEDLHPLIYQTAIEFGLIE